MYLLMVLGLMVVLPIASVVIEAIAVGGGDLFWLIGKWFVFWAAGIRLLLAGLRQIAQPAFTAKTIFESSDPATEKVVQELGFANTAIGMVSVLSLFRPGFVLPAAIAAAIFYGLAGLKHVGNAGKNRLETVAMLSDLWIFALLAIFVIERIAIGAF